MNIPPWQFQRAYTPPLIKHLLQLTCICTLIAVGFGMQEYLTLNPGFYTSFYFWQPISSLFVLPSIGLSFGFLLDFAFLMLVFWLFGSLVHDRIGKTNFLVFYLASGILSGFSQLYVMHSLQLFASVTELMPMILAITVIWAMIDPYQEIMLFFVLPLKAKWVLLVSLFGTLFLSFIQQDVLAFIGYFTAFCFSYLWGLLVLGFQSPFEWMRGIDRLRNRLYSFWRWNVMGSVYRSKAKDDAFVDQTLDKISKNGSSSLTIFEKIRLKWISLKKRLLS